MSRRKQAKPRACLKLGEKEEENGDAGKTHKASDLLEPKEELLSAEEEDGEEEEEDDEQPEEGLSGDENENKAEKEPPNESQQQQNWQPTADDATAATTATTTTARRKGTAAGVVAATASVAAAAEELQHPGDAAEASPLAIAATCNIRGNNGNGNGKGKGNGNGNANGHCKSRSSGGVVASGLAQQQQDENMEELLSLSDEEEEEEPQQELEEDDYDDDDDDEDDDDELELHSLDSFYSDMYSTHTSSSYSPSISDGTMTPNSQQTQPQTVAVAGEDPATEAEKANGEEGREREKELPKLKRPSHLHHHHHYHHQQALKIANKLRKINKDAKLAAAAAATGGGGATKFDKLTGESIKSRGDGSYQCQFCDKSFPRLGYLKHHVQSHAEHLPFKCEYCAKLFKHKRSRDRHKKLHTNERNYKCPHCEAAFSRSDHLKIHMKTHDIQKPFQCSMCNRGYNTAAALTSHMQKHKKNAAILAAGGNPNALNYSPRSTGSASISSNGSLQKRRYALALASDSPSSPGASRMELPKRARVQQVATTPTATPTPTPLLRCSYCPKVTEFSSLEQLNAHLQQAHEQRDGEREREEEPSLHGNGFQLSCEYCTMRFGNIAALFQHMRATHLDRLSSPNSYYGLASPRLPMEMPKIKPEQQELPTDLSSHRRRTQTPPGVFFCNQCNAGLPDFESFRNHLKTHLAEGMQHSCPHCGLNLPEQSELERHVVAHFLLSSSEYNCGASNCGKSYAKADELQQHLQTEHVQSLLKCSLCSELCETRMSMQLHLACAHSQETQLLRCSACLELFRNEQDFHVHVKTRHQLGQQLLAAPAAPPSNPLQCMFCRVVCASELEMHFHLAAHARQFRCPSCPETFHVEFLLDRHMQSQHGGEKNSKDNSNSAAMGSLYVNALLPPLAAAAAAAAAASNNNNNNIDYNVAFKGLFATHSPLQVDTKSAPHPALMYGLSQRYLMEMYAAKASSSSPPDVAPAAPPPPPPPPPPAPTAVTTGNYSCGMCERQDLRSEAELHSHRKLAHNLKTGVSLRCAYCSGNFKSRAELEQHMKSCHNSSGKHKCLICDEIFPSPAILAEHKLQHSKVGQSGKCAHCGQQLEHVAAFRAHLSEHGSDGNLPLACICCRQTLHSEFELSLHAKFHTKSPSSLQEPVCALCLEPLPGAGETAKLCEKCCRKHNLNGKRSEKLVAPPSAPQPPTAATTSFLEHRCNLCKLILPHAQKLQEHLVEHTFAGTEQRGFNCYICSAVFTAPAGLLSHIAEHGARPYDCNLCSEKFYFRAQLEHHQRAHELRPVAVPAAVVPRPAKLECSSPISLSPSHVKQEQLFESESASASSPSHNQPPPQQQPQQEEEEYIEVEQVPQETRSGELLSGSHNNTERSSSSA